MMKLMSTFKSVSLLVGGFISLMKLLPYFPKAFNFLEKARESRGCVLVHYLAGISATIAIAYVMQHLKMNSDTAYVKSDKTNYIT